MNKRITQHWELEHIEVQLTNEIRQWTLAIVAKNLPPEEQIICLVSDLDGANEEDREIAQRIIDLHNSTLGIPIKDIIHLRTAMRDNLILLQKRFDEAIELLEDIKPAYLHPALRNQFLTLKQYQTNEANTDTQPTPIVHGDDVASQPASTLRAEEGQDFSAASDTAKRLPDG
jgi:hypothetical protein